MIKFYVALLVIAAIQLVPGIHGAELLFGISTVLGLFVFAVSFCVPWLGPLFAAFLAYYGARYGWGWTGWQALLLAAPGVVVPVAAIIAGRFLKE